MSAADPVLSGAAWRKFCADLADVGEMILDPGNPSSPIDRAEGYRYLTRLLRMGLEQQIEARDLSFPYFYQLSHPTGKIGADNPDNVYWNARISGQFDYKITIRRGTMAYFSILSNAFRYQEDGTNACTGKLIDSDIDWGPDGVAVLIASATPQPKNWLPLEADSNMLIVRQSYLDRTKEKPGEFAIERIGRPPVPPPLDPAALGAGLNETIAFLRGIVGTFVDWSKMFARTPNAFDDIDQQMYQRGGGGVIAAPGPVHVHAQVKADALRPLGHALGVQKIRRERGVARGIERGRNPGVNIRAAALGRNEHGHVLDMAFGGKGYGAHGQQPGSGGIRVGRAV